MSALLLGADLFLENTICLVMMWVQLYFVMCLFQCMQLKTWWNNVFNYDCMFVTVKKRKVTVIQYTLSWSFLSFIHCLIPSLPSPLGMLFSFSLPLLWPLRWPSGKDVRLESIRSWVQFLLAPWEFFWVESYQRLKNGHSSGCPARHMAL